MSDKTANGLALRVVGYDDSHNEIIGESLDGLKRYRLDLTVGCCAPYSLVEGIAHLAMGKTYLFSGDFYSGNFQEKEETILVSNMYEE